jgi:hypothetical protein
MLENLWNRLKNIIKEEMPLVLIGIGLMMMAFSVWQLDIMFINKMWGSAQNNIEFYQCLINCGFNSWASSNWFTINAEIFPPDKFTVGFWYDALMMMNILSWFPTVLGVYNLRKKVQTLKKFIRENRGQW